MKKVLLVTLAVFFLMGSLSASYAEEGKGYMKHKEDKMYKKDKYGMKHCMMMDKMMPKKMVATPDGGVIVLSGSKLLKYDKDLNLLKEVEIKMDMEGMMKKMKECRDKMKECMDDMDIKSMEEEKDTE